MIEFGLTLAALAALLGSGVFSGAEMGLYSLNRVRLRLRSEEGSRNARLLLSLIKRDQDSVLAILLWQNVAGYVTTVMTTLWLTRGLGFDEGNAQFYSAALLAPLMFVIGDVLPKNVFQIEADRVMYRLAPVLYAGVMLFRYSGLLWVLGHISNLMARFGSEKDTPEGRGPRGEMLWLLRESSAEGLLTEEQTQMVERVMSLSTIRVGSIMIPRRHVATVRSDISRKAFEQLVRGHDYSRLPVLSRDGKSIEGIVNVLDVLWDESGGSVRDWMQPPLTVRAGDSTTTALVRLQQARAKMAVVEDPRHGFVGVITLKDVLEEIFGELPAW